MTQRCPQCSRINPRDAAYCFYDGNVLPARTGANVPIDPSKQPFPNPFVMPSGNRCINFDQLALACQHHWTDAIHALKQGYLERFFDGIGRSDLALAARGAATFPDPDRGLDRLLGQLPTNILQQPSLSVSQRVIRIGPLEVGRDYRIPITIENTGARLLFGSIASDADWLAPGITGENIPKVFQCLSDTKVTYYIRGKKLRAGAVPLEANLAVESNGGSLAIRVDAHVPIRPFERGILAGTESPRHIVELAQQQPDKAAALFEKGDIERWYLQNGWTYPVRLPPATGRDASKQYLEALGFGKPPKVFFEQNAIHLNGIAETSIEHRLKLYTEDQSQLFATGDSDQPWLTVAPAELHGHIAYLPLQIPSVPNFPGETLIARVVVRTNGNQKFHIPVSLQVEASNRNAPPSAIPMAIRLPAQKTLRPEDIPGTMKPGENGSPKALPKAILISSAKQPEPVKRKWGVWKHLIGAIILLLALLAVFLRDRLANLPDREKTSQIGTVETTATT